MKDRMGTLTDGERSWPIVNNLNVMETIQQEFGSWSAWADKTVTRNGEKEIDIRALKFGIMTMINEGIDIQNEETGENRPFVTMKQVGRILTAVGIEEATQTMQKTVVDSVETEEGKNA